MPGLEDEELFSLSEIDESECLRSTTGRLPSFEHSTLTSDFACCYPVVKAVPTP